MGYSPLLPLKQLLSHQVDRYAIYIDSEITSKIVEYYEIDLATILTAKIKIEIDISLLNRSTLGFKFQTLKGKRIFCRDEEFYYSFAEEVLRYYYDFQPLKRRMVEEV